MRILLLTILLAGFCLTVSAQSSALSPETLWSMGSVSLEAAHQNGLLYSVTHTNIADETTDRVYYFTSTTQFAKQAAIVSLPEGAAHLSFTPDGRQLLFLKDEFLYSFNLNTSQTRQISDFPISEYRLAANGSTLAYTQAVKYGTSTKELYPKMSHANVRIIESLNYRHLKDWTDDFHDNLFITSYNENSMLAYGINIMPNEPYDVLSFSISPNGKQVAYECKKMPPNEHVSSTNSDIFLYDLFTRTTLNISKGILGYDANPAFSPDGRYLAWSSMITPVYETDRKRLMVYDLVTNTLQQWIPDFDYNVNNPLWADNNHIIFQTELSGTTQLLVANPRENPTEITQGQYTVGGYFLVVDKEIYYTKSSFTSPPEIFHNTISGEQETQLTLVNKENLANIKFGPVEERFTTTFDGKQLQYWVIYPPDFDPTNTYPCILYCQGGPQSPLTNGWSLRWSLPFFAAQGYIVIAPNRRGVFGFGSEWTREVSENWGDEPMKDLLAATDDFTKKPFVDATRMAAIGASFGGYSVYWLAGNHDNRFNCFLAHAGLFNLESFDGMTDEKFFVDFDMGGSFFSHRNHPTYTTYSPHLYVEKWNRPILISHGGQDFRVLDTEGFQAFNAAQRLGLESKMLYFPDEGHGIRGCHNSILWYKEVTKWLAKYLT